MDRAQYSKACAQVKITVKAAKKDTWQKTTADLNLDHEGNKAWSLLKNLAGDKRTSNPKPMEDNGSTLATDQKKAEHMNRFYASVSRAAELNDQDREKLKNLKSEEKAPKPNPTPPNPIQTYHRVPDPWSGPGSGHGSQYAGSSPGFGLGVWVWAFWVCCFF